MDDENCVICKSSLKEEEIVEVKRGLSSLIEASTERNDGIHTLLSSRSQITVHVNCRKKYTAKQNIKARKRELAEKDAGPATLRSNVTTLNLKTHCILCAEEIEQPNTKLPKSRRRVVCKVTTYGMSENINRYCDERQDEWGNEVKRRICTLSDLIAAEACYHTDCFTSFKTVTKSNERGRPKIKSCASVFDRLCCVIDENEECQYTLAELKNIMLSISESTEHLYSDKHIKDLMKQRYGSKLLCTTLPNTTCIFTLRSSADKYLIEKWQYEKESNAEDEKLRIVRAAATIIRDDIRGAFYNLNEYSSFRNLEEDGQSVIPETLKCFTENVTKLKSGNCPKSLRRKQLTINHAIIATCRPRSFQSTIHVAVSVYLYRKYGSKNLINLFHSMGVCSSYAEATTYLNCATVHSAPVIEESAFFQYVFDNADFNVRTLTGIGTFHSLGGIKCVSPSNAVIIQSTFPRDTSTKIYSEANQIPLLSYKPHANGMKNVILEPVTISEQALNDFNKSTSLDLLWAAYYNTDVKPQGFWNGFMQSAMAQSGKDITQTIPLPFINQNPSDKSTLYSALRFAAEQSRERGRSCIVTLDQPLFMKCSEIVLSADKNDILSSVIVRLGGFHLLFSFLGSVGYVMKGSGIEELWETVYAKNSIPHMMTGHSFARAVRAHILTAVILIQLIVDPDDTDVNKELKTLRSKVFSREVTCNEAAESKELQEFLSSFQNKCNEVESKSRTAKLWVTYLKQILLMLNFIRAEKTGNWELHLATITEMMPLFHAAGHTLYAKSAQLYLQQMNNLQRVMSADEYEKFTTDGCFTIRRQNKEWSGIWTDMNIEQILMRSMKTEGGLTRGRGYSDETVMRWIICAPVSSDIATAVEDFAGISNETSEQHKDLRDSSMKKDTHHINIFMKWIKQHNPFTITENLVSIYSGVVGDNTVTCDLAVEKGTHSMATLMGKTFHEVVIPRKARVVPIAAITSSVTVRGKEVPINVQQLFNRIVCLHNSPEELKECFKYELAPRPTALFNESTMRKATKSSLVTAFKEDEELTIPKKDCLYIIDGGYLLHCALWPQLATYSDVVNAYNSYVIAHFGRNTVIVFDGYPDFPTTKGQAHMLRYRKHVPEVQFNEHTHVTHSQCDFLSNPKNKKALITLLSSHLASNGHEIHQATDDADVLITTVALRRATDTEQVVVVAQDTDILVLLTSRSTTENIWMLRPQSGSKRASMFNIFKQREIHQECKDALLFCHAVSGCDTTSSIFRKGKVKSLSLLKKEEQLRHTVSVFNDSDATKDQIAVAGEAFIIALYGKSKNKTLDEYRYYMYHQYTAKKSLKANFDLASLPPTSAAASQHSFRVYHQVQTWLGNDLDPCQWGWRLVGNSLLPIPTTLPPAPDRIMHVISCNCKKCSNCCGCKRAGLLCTAMCGKCEGLSCENSPEVEMDESEIVEENEL